VEVVAIDPSAAFRKALREQLGMTTPFGPTVML
jgi:hypothetical protein